MAKQVINRGGSVGDPTAESTFAAFGKSKQNFDELYSRAPTVLEYGVVGDGNHSTGSGTNDTSAFQDAIDDVAAGAGTLLVPGNRTYIITDTLSVPPGMEIIGLGGRNGAGVHCPPTLTWMGTNNGGPVMAVETSIASIFSSKLSNILISAKVDQSTPNRPLNGLVFRNTTPGSQASCDTGTELDRVIVQATSGDAVQILGSATNFTMHDCRQDNITNGGYGIYCGPGTYRISITGHCTYTADSGSGGWIFLDGEDSASEYQIDIFGVTTEINGVSALSETFASGTNAIDKHGIIRCGVRTATGSVSHKVRVFGWTHAYAAGPSHSAFQVTAASGSAEDHMRCVNLMVFGGDGLNNGSGSNTLSTGEVSWIGGSIPYRERPTATERQNVRQGLMIFNPGLDATANHVTNWINTREFYTRGLMHDARPFSEFPDSTWLTGAPDRPSVYFMFCTNVNDSVTAGTILSGANTGTNGNLRPVYYRYGDGTDGWVLMLGT